jgi:hypothetical protein
VITPVVPAGARPAHAEGPRKLCTIRDPRINESSGLAASRRHPGIVYTFDDSDGPAKIFALGPDCRVRATLTLSGARNRDWEAMAIGPDGLYVGDIGDNLHGAWPYVTVYRIPEPAVLRSRVLRATAYRIKYADGPRDAEAMMIDPRDGRIFIASKEFGGSLYEGPKKLRTSGFNIMHRVGDTLLYTTDAAFSPDGHSFVIRNYWSATIYSAPGRILADVSIPDQRQGEGITFTADGRSLLLSSEGSDQPLWQVPVPAPALPRPRATHTPAITHGARPAGDRHEGSRRTVLFLAIGIAVAGVLIFGRKRGS